jgi:hypothetical protein
MEGVMNAQYTKLVNGVDLITASNISGIHFNDLLEQIKMGHMQAVLIDFKYFISPDCIPELKKLKEKQSKIGRCLSE